MVNSTIELFLRGLVLCGLTGVALLLLRRAAAAYRHLVCVLALFGLLILPLAQRLLPPLRMLPSDRATASERATVSSAEAGRLPDVNRMLKTPSSTNVPHDPVSRPASLNPVQSETMSLDPALHNERSRRATVLLFTIWSLGAAVLLLRLIVALLRLRSLEAASRRAMLGSVPVLINEQVKTPLTWGGVRRSIILLPAALLSGDPAVCVSALRHEQAHIARWDWVWNLLAELICAFCWFQPGVWWLRSRMRLESERACDDRVLLSGVAGADYAAHLLEIVRSACAGEVAPGMAQSCVTVTESHF